MRTSRLIVALVLAAALITFALQNMTPTLALVFLGGRTVALPLAVWLVGAIALGALTALILVGVTAGGAGSSSRRRWRVTPDPGEGPGREPRRRPSPPREPSRAAPPPPYTGNRQPGADRSGDDWGAWEQRAAPQQWDDWSQMGGSGGPDGRSPSQRQRDGLNTGPQGQRQQADARVRDVAAGWDPQRERQRDGAQGSNEVDDALDDIASGWGDWGDRPPGLVDEPPPATTAYSYRYGEDTETRQDPVYAPPDDWVDGDGDDDAPEESEGVYDADYRVIIPPYRPPEEDAQDKS